MPRISVGIRMRPLISSLDGTGNSVDDGDDSFHNNKIIFNRDKGNNIEIVASGIKHDFNFDKLYTDEVSQEEIFKSCTSPM